MAPQPRHFTTLVLGILLILSSASCAVCAHGQKPQQHAGDQSISVPTVTILEVKKMMDAGTTTLIIDIRDKEDFADGHISGAINIPRDDLQKRLPELVPDKSANVVLYCQTDRRSPPATKTINDLGYKNAVDMKGGFDAWEAAAYPTVKPAPPAVPAAK